MFQSPAHTKLNEIFLQVHQGRQVDERDLRFYHPEFGQVPGRVAVLRPERRTECIDSSQSRGSEFAFQLSTYRQRSHFAEEIVVVLNLSVLIFLQIVQILSRDLKHFSRSFAIACRNDRSVEVKESVFVKVGMNSHGQVVSNTHHGTESIGTQTEMSVLTHIFETLSFFLHRVIVSAQSIDFNTFCLYFGTLFRAFALHQFPLHADTGSCR